MDVCERCGDKGEYLGIGMMLRDCELCNSPSSDKKVDKPVSLEKIDRRSKSYRDTIAELMSINKISRAKAVKMFDELYSKS